MKRIFPALFLVCAFALTAIAQDPVVVKVLVPEGVKVEVVVVPKDPKLPPPIKTDKFYFAIVRPDGPASPSFTKQFTADQQYWNKLAADGHKYKDFQLSYARTKLGLNIPAGTGLPCVVGLIEGLPVSKWQVYGPVPVPVGADVLKLPAQATPPVVQTDPPKK